MGLWKFLWHYSKLNTPKSLLLYLVSHGTIPALLYWDMLGPFNCPPEMKYLFNEHLTQNFIICTVICVNSFQFSALMCFTFVALSFAGFMGQCNNPFPGVQELIEENGCENFVQAAMTKRISFALHVFGSHYVQRLIFSGVYIEREMMRMQKGQLRDYFSSQDQGILVLRKAESIKPQNMVSFVNPVL